MADRSAAQIFADAKAKADAAAVFKKSQEAAATPAADREPAPGEHKPSQFESLYRGYGQGGTLGFGEEISGLLGAAAEVNGRMNPFNNTDSVYPELGVVDAAKKRYALERDAMREEDLRAKTANPGTYVGGQLTGALAASLATGGASAPAAGASLATKVGIGALTGGATGAASGLGYSGADLTQGEYGDAAMDTLKGGALGTAAGAAVPLVTSVTTDPLRKLVESLVQKYAPKAAAPAVQAVEQAAGSTLQDSPRALAQAAEAAAPSFLSRAGSAAASVGKGAALGGATGAAGRAAEAAVKGEDPASAALEGLKYGALAGSGLNKFGAQGALSAARVVAPAIVGGTEAVLGAIPNAIGVARSRTAKAKDVAQQALSTINTSSPDSREISQLLQHIASSSDPETSMASFRFINPKLNKFLMDHENNESEVK